MEVVKEIQAGWYRHRGGAVVELVVDGDGFCSPEEGWFYASVSDRDDHIGGSVFPGREYDCDLVEFLGTDETICEAFGIEAKTGSDRRSGIIDTVRSCVCSDRQNTYGDALDNFTDIANLASTCLSGKLLEPLTAEDVATFSACIKLARLKTSPGHIDNWVDLAGYAVCGGGIMEAKNESR
jgi:hypothetical protein